MRRAAIPYSIAAGLLAVAVGCGKEAPLELVTGEAVPPDALVVLRDPSGSLSGDYRGELGGQPVALAQSDGHHLVFLVPMLSPGAHELKVRSATGESFRPLRVEVAPPAHIDDPDAAIAAFLNSVESEFAGSTALPATETAAQARTYLEDLRKHVSSAPAEDRLRMARLIALMRDGSPVAAAGPWSPNQVVGFDFNASVATVLQEWLHVERAIRYTLGAYAVCLTGVAPVCIAVAAAAGVQIGLALFRLSNAYQVLIDNTFRPIGAEFGASSFATSGRTQLSAEAAFAFRGTHFGSLASAQVRAQARDTSESTAFRISTQTERSTTDTLATGGTGYLFLHSLRLIIPMSIRVTNLSAADVNSTNGALAPLLRVYHSLREGVDAVNAYLPTDYAMPVRLGEAPERFGTIPVDTTRMSFVTQTTAPSITVAAAAGTATHVYLEVRNAECQTATDATFTLTLGYDDPSFGKLAIPISGTLRCNDPCELIGSWTGYNCAVQCPTVTCTNKGITWTVHPSDYTKDYTSGDTTFTRDLCLMSRVNSTPLCGGSAGSMSMDGKARQFTAEVACANDVTCENCYLICSY